MIKLLSWPYDLSTTTMDLLVSLSANITVFGLFFDHTSGHDFRHSPEVFEREAGLVFSMFTGQSHHIYHQFHGSQTANICQRVRSFHKSALPFMDICQDTCRYNIHSVTWSDGLFRCFNWNRHCLGFLSDQFSCRMHGLGWRCLFPSRCGEPSSPLINRILDDGCAQSVNAS